MPPLSSLALRYTAWFVGLSFAFGILSNLAGVPGSLATGVILAAAPAADVGLQATKRATRRLAVRDWTVIWGLCFGIYLLLGLIGPALLFPPLRESLSDPAALGRTALVIGSTALMMTLFMWIGNRSAGGRGQG
ncbi:hypothetical protein N8I71_11775 [Roseibacterium sp. SDUM158016]|uniref:hypothetical protein n=1 Tax=Roseicyclus sediminis TaxID=2980997 RepID=UPI0021D0F675|nr:hypothetical protein [Roseibacterium sp. SDUM158016]MCU4653512.1 hypothetical protein [Roseibacterium sp. SDUM158016]